MSTKHSTIYTKTGDSGTTRLATGIKIPKNYPEIEVYGNIDELNSAIGIVLAHPDIPANIQMILTRIQTELFDFAKALCTPEKSSLDREFINRIENDIDAIDVDLPTMTHFLRPGGSLPAAHCHLARAICRRAERGLVSLHQEKPLQPEILQYMNRLSDLLFVIARAL